MWIATLIAGDNAFGVRMAQGFAGAMTVLILALFARRVARRDFHFPELEARTFGILAGLLLLISPMMIVESKIATADAFLVRFLALAHVGLYESIRPRETGQRDRPWWLLFWISCGLAVLAKGFVGWILPLGTAGLLALWMRFFPPAGVEPSEVKPRWRGLRFGRGALLSLVCVLPWVVAVSLRTNGEFLREAIWTHQVQRSLHPFEGHGGSLIFYPLSLLLGFFPGVAFLALWFGRQEKGRDEGGGRTLGIRFFICWAFFPVLPSYPALSVLAALGFVSAKSSGGRWVGIALLIFLTLVLLGGGIVVTRFAAERIPPETWDGLWAGLRPVLILLEIMLLTTTILLVLAIIRRGIQLAVVGILPMALITVLICTAVLPALEGIRVFPAMGRELKERGVEKVFCSWTPEPSLVYYGDLEIEKLGGAEEVATEFTRRSQDPLSRTAALFRVDEWENLPLRTRPRGPRLHFQGLNVARGDWGRWVVVPVGGPS
jgi:4-amino-4-deoxy-L-arabinose transferase-like glycosyltransferase